MMLKWAIDYTYNRLATSSPVTDVIVQSESEVDLAVEPIVVAAKVEEEFDLKMSQFLLWLRLMFLSLKMT